MALPTSMIDSASARYLTRSPPSAGPEDASGDTTSATDGLTASPGPRSSMDAAIDVDNISAKPKGRRKLPLNISRTSSTGVRVARKRVSAKASISEVNADRPTERAGSDDQIVNKSSTSPSESVGQDGSLSRDLTTPIARPPSASNGRLSAASDDVDVRHVQVTADDKDAAEVSQTPVDVFDTSVTAAVLSVRKELLAAFKMKGNRLASLEQG